MPETEASALGKRKRQDRHASAEQGQARIDRYFSLRGAVKQPLAIPNGQCDAQNDASTIQAACNNQGLPKSHTQAQTGQPAGFSDQVSPDAPQGSVAATEVAKNSACGETSEPAEHKPDTAPQVCDRDQALGSAASMPAAKAVKTSRAKLKDQPQAMAQKPLPQRSHVVQDLAAAQCQQHLPEHLAVFLEHLSERQQFREYGMPHHAI